MMSRFFAALCKLVVFAVLVAPSAAQQVSIAIDDPGFGFVDDIATDGEGNLFVSSRSKDRVVKVTPAGSITIVLDESGDGQGALLERPRGIDTDAAGNLYVVGHETDNVFKVRPTGEVSVILDASGDGMLNALTAPYSLAVTDDGTVYITSQGPDQVFRVSPSGLVEVILEFDPNDPLATYQGTIFDSIALDSAGNVYVGSINDLVFKVTPQNLVSVVIDGDDGLEYAGGLATDSDDNLYIANTGFVNGVDRVYRVRPDGDISVALLENTPELFGAEADNLYAMAAGSDGKVYVSSKDSGTVFEIRADGGVSQVVPTPSGASAGGLLTEALAVAPDGTLYMALNGAVSKLTTPSGWDNLGSGLAGTLGEPQLAGNGQVFPGKLVNFVVRDVELGSIGALVIGITPLNAPFKGGTLVPDPLIIRYNLEVDEPAEQVLRALWPFGISGVPLITQFWVPDAGAPVGYAASNALIAKQP